MLVNIRTRKARYAARIVIVVAAGFAGAHVDKAGAAAPANSDFGQARVASAGSFTGGRVLGGLTAQHWPVIVTLSKSGKRMSANVALDMHCTSGYTWTAPDGWIEVPVSASGIVRASGAISPSPGSATQDTISGGQDRLTGKLNRRRATFSGVWELQLNFTSPSGQSDSCDSGPVSFSVRL